MSQISIENGESGLSVRSKLNTLLQNTGMSGLGAAVRKPKGVLCQVGDSNTDNNAGRPDWEGSVYREWLAPGGIFEGWTNYNVGFNGASIATWVLSIATGDTGAAVTTRHDVHAVKNANPDVIIVSLGTNDEGTPADRSGIGTEANLRANLSTLINWFLANCPKAVIWLRMPQPFAHENFASTDWANAAEAIEASRRVRLIYQEWIGKSDRVEVFDSHAALFGNSCDDKATDCQDPYGEGALLADSLHLTDIGYRRVVEFMSRQANGRDALDVRVLRATEDVFRNAVWHATAYCSIIEQVDASALLSFYGNPSHLLNGEGALRPGVNRTSTKGHLPRVEDYYLLGNHSFIQQLRALGGRGAVKVYFPASGNIYTATGVRYSSVVVTEGQTRTLFFFDGTDMTDEDAGPVTVYAEAVYQQPTVFPQFLDFGINPGRTNHVGLLPNRLAGNLRLQIVRVTVARDDALDGGDGSGDVYLVTNNAGSYAGSKIGAFTMGYGTEAAEMVVDGAYSAGIFTPSTNPNQTFSVRLANVVNCTAGHVRVEYRYLV